MEIFAYNIIKVLDYKINYWRTKSGLEVDFLVDGRIAIEVKVSSNINSTHQNSLKAINDEFPIEKFIIICRDPNDSLIRHNDFSIRVLPVEKFLQELCSNEIF